MTATSVREPGTGVRPATTVIGRLVSRLRSAPASVFRNGSSSGSGGETMTGVVSRATTERTPGSCRMRRMAPASIGRARPGLGLSVSSASGAGAAGATWIPARGPPFESWVSTRVRAAPEMISSALEERGRERDGEHRERRPPEAPGEGAERRGGGVGPGHADSAAMARSSTVRIARDATRGIVRDRDHRDGPFARDLVEQVEHDRRGPAVEVAGRLVGEQERGFVRERACECDPLRLATAQVRRPVVGAVRDPHRGEQLVGPGASPATVDGAERHGELDVLASGQVAEQAEVLEHEAHGRMPVRGEGVAAERVELGGADDDRAPLHAFEAAEQREEGGLARAGRAHHRDALTRVDVEVESREHRDATGPAVIFEGHRAGGDRDSGHGRGTVTARPGSATAGVRLFMAGSAVSR